MLTLVLFFLLLNILPQEPSFIHPSCFWRMQQNEENDVNILRYYTFFIFPLNRIDAVEYLEGHVREQFKFPENVLFFSQTPSKLPDWVLCEEGLCTFSITYSLTLLSFHSTVADDASSKESAFSFNECHPKWVEVFVLLNTVSFYRKRNENYRFILALFFSVDEVNRNPDLLPNMTLVFEILSSGCKTLPKFRTCIEYARTKVTGGRYPNYHCKNWATCIVMLSGPSWVVSSMDGTAMQSLYPYQIFQLTFGPFHPILSDRDQFPFLYQMAPEDTSLPLAMVSLILHFRWNWVGLTISDNDQGIQFFSYLRTEMEKNMLCFAFVNVIPFNIHLYRLRTNVYYNQILTSSSNVVIIYGETDSTLAVSFRMWTFGGIQKIWVTTSQFDVTTSKSDFLPESFHGTLAFAHHHAEISGFKNFLQTVNPLKYSYEYLAGLEWLNFNCAVSASMCKTLRNCLSNNSLEWLIAQTFDMAFSDDSYDIYNAVYSMAHAIQDYLLQSMDNQEVQLSKCMKMYSLLRKTHFTNPLGDRVTMNQKEKLQAEYDIFQIWNFPNGLGLKVKIGMFSPYFPHDQQLHLYEDVIEWSTGSRQMPPSVCSADCGPGFRKFRQEGMAACCFDCSPCPENEISNATTSAYLHVRMSSPPTLERLARKSLLKNEALANASLKQMPKAFFPPLFIDAFKGNQTNIIRAMVAAWPFPCLPVGALMKTPNLKTLKVVLGGLDLLIKQKDQPGCCKLQELDLRDAQHNFWNFWVGTEDGVCSPDVISETRPVVYSPRRGGKQVVTVWMNLSLKSRHLSKYLKYFYRWAKLRKKVVLVMCPKLEFGATPLYNPLTLLEVFEPGSIEEFTVSARWNLRTLVKIAPGLSQMKNLQKILLNGISVPFEWFGKRKIINQCITEIIHQIPELKKIQHLKLNDVCFLNERLDQVLRCMESPLETLSITRCLLSNADMSYLSQCPSIHMLKHLDLSGVTFLNLDHLLLGNLLERLTATLQTLQLKGCMIMDFQISALLPALSQCTQLIEVNFLKNFLSVASIRKLLQHTAKLTLLTRELYPAPDEVYDDIGDVHPDRFSQHCSELMGTLRAIRQPKEVYFVSKRCLDCRDFSVYNMETALCSCWQ